MTTPSPVRRIFKSLVMNPVSVDTTEFFNPGYLVVQGGRIESLGPDDPSAAFPDAEFIDLGRFAILPGMVDTHVHLPQFAIMGAGTGSLLEWLKDYTYPEESRFSDPRYARRISETFFDALLANGTTCAAIYSSIHETATDIAFEVAEEKNLRAFIGKAMMDRNTPAALLEDTRESLRASLRLFEKWDGANDGRLRYAFTPRFAGSCSKELMRDVGQVARDRQAFIQSHLSENPDEVNWIRTLFPESASYTAVYDEAGMLGARSIMGHCIHLSTDEVALLAQSGAGVAFCPYSNRVLRSGIMPYPALAKAGIRIGLGSDIAGGPTLSMFRQMGESLNSANVEQQSLSASGALYLATAGGAKVLKLEDRIGNFAEGKDADFVVVDHESVSPVRGLDAYNRPDQILLRLCYRGDAQCVREVYIRGERVAGWNPSAGEVCANARNRARRLRRS